MIIAWQDNRFNGHELKRALTDAGHTVEDALPLLRSGKVGDVLLTDYDQGPPYEDLCSAHEKVLVHPHGAGLVGWTAPHPHTIGQFVHGPGQVEVLKRAGYPRRVEAIGWNFCEQRPFRGAVKDKPYVLFGVQHRMNDGWIEPWMEAMHRPIAEALMALPVWPVFRAIHAPYGIHEKFLQVTDGSYGIQIGEGSIRDAVWAVDQADVVIGPAYTLPCIAIARGVPTIMFGQKPRETPGYGYPTHPLASWGKYVEISTYPWSVEGAPMDEAIRVASSNEASRWRERFIGPAFDADAFVAQFERAVREW